MHGNHKNVFGQPDKFTYVSLSDDTGSTIYFWLINEVFVIGMAPKCYL